MKKLMAHEYKFDAVQQRVVTGMLFTVMPLTPALSPSDGERETSAPTLGRFESKDHGSTENSGEPAVPVPVFGLS